MSGLTKLSLQELKKLSQSVKREIAKKEALSKQSLLKKIRQLFLDEGIDLAEFSEIMLTAKLAHAQKRKKGQLHRPKKTIEPKYFHQADITKTWTGRGKKPEWVNTWVENGGNLEDLKKHPS